MPDTIIVYGSYGYTGKLIVQECRERNLAVILSGRNREALMEQHAETGYPFEVVDVNDRESLKQLLRKGKVVIHCAGPFRFTAQAMVQACLQTGTTYTDITGEYEVFELLANYDEQAKKAGIMVMPGTGFDVVPSDCLALHLKNRLPTATHLQLAFNMVKGGVSRGTSKTMIEGLGEGSMIRKDGQLLPVALGEKVIEVKFGSKQKKALNIPWGDIATAWRSTGIPNIEVYMGASDKLVQMAKLSRYINFLLRQRWLKKLLQNHVDKKSPGPDESRRTAGKTYLWGKVWDASGKEVVSTIETLSGYSFTAKSSVRIAEKVLQGKTKAGYQTPAMMYGADLVLEFENTFRQDISG